MSEEQDPEKKIVIDSDWKEQVRQEKEKLKGEPELGTSSQSANSVSEGEAEDAASTGVGQFPPADFMLLISMLATQAFSAMGQIPDPVTGQASKHPDVAKHMIDLLAVLEEKTKGNLNPQEKAVLESVLHQLRMAFIAAGK
ncbi:DUF1844 domain-containing protein [Blastopirellula marina]|uniref:DUF1844 domain-containing protein n=1 Tax=Blastopirellula marina TaxID=124 RepID=A0A2S8G7I9_9BACT|nr:MULTISPECIES: DUF1844 domain-containing protein [Pirellulaceae]PQO40260.1 DUF1844 domain-containing protein [Blastopirellula marina]RCS55808.1 DUF1844 domain-containing protein [Bremerella cremea]